VVVGRVWKNLELRVREARMLKAELSGQFWLELRMLIGMWTVKTVLMRFQMGRKTLLRNGLEAIHVISWQRTFCPHPETL
jgi:hypothetical protein